MKRIFSVNRSSENIDIAILLLRIGVAVFMLTHGFPKFELFGETPVKFMDVMGLGPEASLLLAISAEVGCSLLILFGLATRIAVIPLIVTMLVAVFIAHSGDPFAVQEKGLLYMLVYIALFLTGSGRYSLDKLISNRWER